MNVKTAKKIVAMNPGTDSVVIKELVEAGRVLAKAAGLSGPMFVDHTIAVRLDQVVSVRLSDSGAWVTFKDGSMMSAVDSGKALLDALAVYNDGPMLKGGGK